MSEQSAELSITDVDEQLRILNEVRAKIHGDPRCNRSGCHGRGVLGIRENIVNKKRILVLQTCQCAVMGKNEYALLQDTMNTGLIEVAKGLDEFMKEIRIREIESRRHIDVMSDWLYDHTITGFLINRIKRFIKWIGAKCR